MRLEQRDNEVAKVASSGSGITLLAWDISGYPLYINVAVGQVRAGQALRVIEWQRGSRFGNKRTPGTPPAMANVR